METQPQNSSSHPRTLSDIFSPLTRALGNSLAAEAPQSPEDPRLQSLVSSRAMNIQLATADKLHAVAMRDPNNLNAAGKLIRVLALLDRTQNRVERNTHPEIPEDREYTVQRQEAHTFLQAELKTGPRSVNDLTAAAAKMGIARRTLLRAKADLNIHSVLNHTPTTRCWMWSLTFPVHTEIPQEAAAETASLARSPEIQVTLPAAITEPSKST